MQKRNVRKIPDSVRRKLDQIEQREVAAACAITYTAQELTDGVLAHLGIAMMPSELLVPSQVLPPPDSGKYSLRNVEGEERIRKDLGKYTDYTPVEAPDWGDWSNGTHTVYLPHDKWHRDFIPPAHARMKMECDNTSTGRESYTIKFEIDEVLDRDGDCFEERLLACLNLLQENVHACGVGVPDAPLAAYVRTLQVTWELFPPGRRDELRQAMFRGRTEPSAEKLRVFHERADFFESLNPEEIVVGTSGFVRYFGARIRDDLVVFDNLEYGNAVYIMGRDWKVLSQISRTQLLAGVEGDGFERVVHREGWQKKVRYIVENWPKDGQRVTAGGA